MHTIINTIINLFKSNSTPSTPHTINLLINKVNRLQFQLQTQLNNLSLPEQEEAEEQLASYI